jgi:hypothetical protein
VGSAYKSQTCLVDYFALVAPSFALAYAQASEGQVIILKRLLALRSFGDNQSVVVAS